MKIVKDWFKKQKTMEIILGCLMILYLLAGIQLPSSLNSAFNSWIGQVIMLLIVFYMFCNSNIILGILTLLVVLSIMMNNQSSTMSIAMNNQPSEETKSQQFTQFNQFPYTLEQEMVKKMVPLYSAGDSINNASYVPIMDNVYDSSPVNSTN
jgi:hypothetical protein